MNKAIQKTILELLEELIKQTKPYVNSNGEILPWEQSDNEQK